MEERLILKLLERTATRLAQVTSLAQVRQVGDALSADIQTLRDRPEVSAAASEEPDPFV